MAPTSRHGVPARCLRASAPPRLAPAALLSALSIACSNVNVPNPQSLPRRACAPRCWHPLRRGWRWRRCWPHAGRSRRCPAAPAAAPSPAAAPRRASCPPWACRRCWRCCCGRRRWPPRPRRGWPCGRVRMRAWCAHAAWDDTIHTGPSEGCLKVLSRSLVKSVLACRVPLRAWQSHARGLHACSLSAGGRRRIHPPAAAVPPHHCMCWVVTMAA